MNMKQGGGTTYYGRKPLDTHFEGERTSEVFTKARITSNVQKHCSKRFLKLMDENWLMSSL